MPASLCSAAAIPALLAVLAGCAAPPRRAAAPPAPRPVTERQRTANDQDLYRAVTAYVQGDYDEADALLAGILRRDPSNRDAVALKRRVSAAQRLGRR
jgi:hypothetical protein